MSIIKNTLRSNQLKCFFIIYQLKHYASIKKTTSQPSISSASMTHDEIYCTDILVDENRSKSEQHTHYRFGICRIIHLSRHNVYGFYKRAE